MQRIFPIRSWPIRSWRRAGLCGLLCLALPGTAAVAAGNSSKPSAHLSNTDTASSTQTASPPSATTHSSPHKKSKHASGKTSRGKAKTKSSRKRGQQVVDSQRAREIQQALIREHYLDGEPSGKWDSATQAAMQRYQADQGWQSKTIPDSRALIKLGLGLSPEQLLNPESAMTTAPAPPDPKAPAKHDNTPPQP